MTLNPAHPTELTLRRLFAGEPIEPSVTEHQASCDDCRARLKAIEDEQRRFEQSIPFDRFAAGVERAARTPRQVQPPARVWPKVLMALAACLLAIAVAPVLSGPRLDGAGNRTKGGSGIDVVIAGAAHGPQRMASADPTTPEALSPGERVRIGYHVGPNRYLVAVSVDEQGEVTPIYAEGNQSLPVQRDAFLPDSLEFTGAGLERVIVVLTTEPLSLDEVRRAVKTRYDEARGNLSQLGTLDLPGEQFHRTFLKP